MSPLTRLALAAALLGALAAEAEIELREVAAAWGADFRHHHGGSGRRYMVETMVGGVVVFDYDGDGDEDLFFVDGGALPGYDGVPPASRLLRNDGPRAEPRFVDVTAASGLSVTGYGSGAVAGDIDGDDDLDLYVTAFGPNQLFRNRGDGTFEDVTVAAGVEEPRWSAGAAFADVDGDGALDLYVANYVDFSVEDHRYCGDEERGVRAYCGPSVYQGVPDRLFRNRGDGTFVEATAAAGLTAAPSPGLGVLFGDLDGDLWPELYVANDETPNFLFRNRRDGTFEDFSLLSGTSYGDRGKPEAGMGVDLGDYDGDGDGDLVVTNFELETNALYQNLGEVLFKDDRFPAGLAEPSLLELAFGVVFADLDQDGDEDLAVANGHILDNAAVFEPSSRYRQQNQLFENLGGRFRLVTTGGMTVVRASRGLAAGDLDGDGDLDLVVVNSNDLAEVYENRSRGGRWLSVTVGGVGSLHGVGGLVEIETKIEAGDRTKTGIRRQWRQLRTGGSYLSQSSLAAHFGVGKAVEVRSLTLRRPGAGVHYLGLPVDRRLRVTEPVPSIATPGSPVAAASGSPVPAASGSPSSASGGP